MDQLKIMPNRGPAVTRGGITQRFRIHEGITIAVAANPGTKTHKTGRTTAERLFPTGVKLWQRGQKDILHRCAGIFDLVSDKQLFAAQWPRLPQKRNLTVDGGV